MFSLQTHQPKPKRFKEHTYRREYKINHTEGKIWKWLNNPKTFTENQMWPCRVEFTPAEDQTDEFREGVFNSHHGPLMSFTGVLGEIKPNYRDLKYLYGSYFLSFRWIRPHRLQFWTETKEDHVILTMQLNSYVAPSFYNFWNWGQKIFWARFGRWCNRSVSKL